MIQGTTPKHTFNLDIKTELIDKLRISYEQNGKIVLSKEKKDCTIGESAVATSLTQEETLKFNAPGNARIQLHATTTNGASLVTRPMSVPVHILLDKVVL